MFMETRSHPEFIPTPGEEGQLKGVLKKNKIDEKKNETRTIEPKKVITRLNYWNTLHHLSTFLNSQPHFRNYHL